MKRFKSALFLCLFLFTLCFQTVSAANVKDATSYPLESGASINANSITVWGNYIFASTIDNGLEIIDMEDNSVIAKWNLSDNSIIPGLSSFTSIQTVVTDEYIICANNLYVVVFPNEGKYTNTPPKMIARVTPNPSKAKRTFNQLKRMFESDGFLYLFDLSASNQISAIGGEKNHAVVWKVPLENFDDIEYKYDSLKWASLEDMENVEFSDFGEYEYFWETVKIDGNNAYCVTYNNENVLPKKTLFLNVIDIETLSHKTSAIMQNDASGLQAQFEVEGTISMEEIRSLELYVTRVDETEYVPLSSFLDVENTEYLMIDINENDGKSTVKIMFSEDVISALVDVFDCREDQIVNNGIIFAVDVGEETHEFVYITNDASYQSGVCAIDSEKNYAFVMTGAATGDNMLISVNTSGDIEAVGKKIVTPVGTYNIAVDAICENNSLIALYKGVSSRAAVYDISNPASIPYNFERTLELESGIYLSNTLSQMVHYGNKYYYADTMGKNIGALNTDEEAVFARIVAKDGNMPVRVYGYNSTDDAVLVSLDGGEDIEVPVSNGVWSYSVAMTENGAHTIDVSIGGYEKHFDYNVNVPLPVDVKSVSYNDYDELCAVIENNTDKYDGSLRTKNLKAVAVLYDEDGTPIVISEKDTEVDFGESKTIDFSDILSYDVEDYNGTVKIYVLNSALAPLTIVHTYNGTSLAEAEIPTVAGKIASISLNDPSVDANNKKFEVSGTLECDGERPVIMVVSRGEYVYDVAQTVCDEDGKFSFTYSYEEDSLSGEGSYSITVNAMMGGTSNEKSQTVTVMDQSAFNEKMTYISENITTAQGLLDYLSENENKKFAREAGMDVDDEKFAALSNADKLSVMGECLSIIKSSDKSALKTTFNQKTATLYDAAYTKKVIEEINSAKQASLYGVLKNYKDYIGISETLWNKYNRYYETSNTTKLYLINKYFLKEKITALSAVENQLKDAINDANDSGGGGQQSDKVTSSDKISGDFKLPAQETVVTPVNPDLVYNPDEVAFEDLDGVAWAKKEILALAEQKIVNGISRTQYNPNDTVTREQFIKMLVIALNMEDSSAVSSFADVKEGAWYYKYVASAEKWGLAVGDGENFGIGKPMTREEMATFLYRAAQIAKIELPEAGGLEFADADEIAAYAREAVSVMQKMGIISGTDENMFAPKMNCTRAMAAKVVYELLNI